MNKSPMEKHIQTILSGVVTVLLLWVGSSVNSQGIAIATLTERVATLQLEIRNTPTLSRDEVINLMSPHKELILDAKGRIESHEQRIKRIEQDLYVSYPNPNRQIK